MTPEELNSFAQSFYKICTDCILRRNGFVVEFVGDAVLAIFGAPVAFDYDAESAIRAALDIRSACKEFQTFKQPMNIRFGIATGVIHSGATDSAYGRVYNIIGDTVNLAARLQVAAGIN